MHTKNAIAEKVGDGGYLFKYVFVGKYSVKAEKSVMGPSERRVLGSLLLLSSLTFLTLGLYTGQLKFVTEIMKKIFETAVAGAP